MEIILWLHNTLFASAIVFSPYFNKISAKSAGKSVKVCVFVLHKEFLESKFKNGQLRQIIHEVHMHFSLWDTLVVVIYMESICLQICPFTSELRKCFHLN